MGGGNDTLTNSGTMTATGGSAIDMGAGDDIVVLRGASHVTGAILLGDGNDVFRGSSADETVDGGDGNDRLNGGLGADQHERRHRQRSLLGRRRRGRGD